MLEFVCGFFLYASFVIYISISMVEIMWVRVNYECLTPLSTIFQFYRVGQFIMIEETGVPRIVLYNIMLNENHDLYASI